MQTMQPMAYSAPAITEAKHQLGILVRYFSFFRPHPKTGWEKEKYRSIVKELIYRTISFEILISIGIMTNFVPFSPFCYQQALFTKEIIILAQANTLFAEEIFNFTEEIIILA